MAAGCQNINYPTSCTFINRRQFSIPTHCASVNPIFSPSNHKLHRNFPLYSSLKFNSTAFQLCRLTNGQTHFKTSSSANGSLFTSTPAFELELRRLLTLLPHKIKKSLIGHPELEHLIEIVMDLGRKPLARFPSGDFRISEDSITFQDLEQAISMVGDFADDNRADMIRDLVEGGGSLLLIGPPGVGKTTVIREISRMLADDYKKRVVIVDTSNEIAGDGDIPHPGIGNARRMQVPNVNMQHKVMIEAVENHMPETIVIDEIGTELEALAASTIAQRGIQLVGTAHGVTIENLIKNPSLEILVGGIQSVTLGDEEALRRGVQKTVLERKGPPAFTCAVEMMSKTEWRVHHSLEATVDAVLVGRPPLFEARKMDRFGEIGVNSNIMTPAKLGYSSCENDEKIMDEAGHNFDVHNENYDDNDYISAFRSRVKFFGKDDNMPLRLYAYQIMEANLEQVLEAMGLENAVELTNDIGAADAMLALNSKIKQNSWIKEMAKYRQLPVFVIKANTTAQMARAMRAIFGMESLGAPLSSSNRFKNGYMISEEAADRRNSSEEIDALEEVRLAIEDIVIPKGQPVELLPRCSEIIALQMKLVNDYKLTAEKAGTETNSRLRVLPLHASSKESNISDMNMEERHENSLEDVDVSRTSGTTVSRLPLLPDC
ncbi:protein SEEDLING PLASTID DEVELOPMENT 1 isoform X2 [Cryptomeria japonica]|uniref:protein SEEDLING PLASTID DEVELOPMENT 1 isoform X2 n=1 Tax=Cryptomeria japonica TaxID=3369 RepID=UPI0027D9D442|nr:protein SEEDLING PLASTID DEVELOPMENT 1 isoform X2 [Cryptomeria japonica]